MNSIRVLLAHPGTQYAPHLARELSQAGLLHRYWTGWAFAETGWEQPLLSRLPVRIRRLLQNRIVSVHPSQLRRLPLIEWRGHRAKTSGQEEAFYFDRNRRFQLAIPEREILAADIIIGYDTSSWLLAERAKNAGKCFILDQSIGHPVAKEEIFTAIRSRFPNWSSSAPCKAEAHLLAENTEHNLADLIVVPSRFVERTLVSQGVDTNKICVIPFGTDLLRFHPSSSGHIKAGPVIFLFLGGISARKGVPVLLDAWRRQAPRNAELWLAGPGSIPTEEAATVPETVRWFGPQSRDKVATMMRRADVFVFPSFFEGLAQVQIEAQASGLPLIATPEAGAEELIEPGRNGFLVPAGDAATLAARMAQLAEDADLRRRMRQAAIEARNRLSWRAYGERWRQLLNDLVSSHPPAIRQF